MQKLRAAMLVIAVTVAPLALVVLETAGGKWI